MEVHYNLLDEPWIPCVLPDGTFQMYNLQDCLLHAHEIREIHAELPPMTASLLMLLLAVLYRSLALETEDDWIDCWESEKFDSEIINNYLNQWHTRFDLFDEKHPFYQDPLIGFRQEDINKIGTKSISRKNFSEILMHVSSNDSPTLFDHSVDDKPKSYPANIIAQHLLMFQQFSLGGTMVSSIPKNQYSSDAPHSRGIVFFVKGKNLFETLLLNLVPKEELPETMQDYKNDLPIWEVNDPLANKKNLPKGIADFLTWFSRRILLIPEIVEENIYVQQIIVTPGLKLEDQVINPFYNSEIKISSNGDVKKSFSRLSESRALWRDSFSILNISHKDKFPPYQINWLSDISIGNNICFNAFGICPKPAEKKAYFYREENFVYPSIYLQNNEIRQELERQLNTANEVNSLLQKVIRLMAELIITPNSDQQKDKRKAYKKDKKKLFDHWNSEMLYWKSLEHPFYQLVNHLPVNLNQAITRWQETLRNTARETLDQTISFTGTDTKTMKAAIQAKHQLVLGLAKVLDPLEKEE